MSNVLFPTELLWGRVLYLILFVFTFTILFKRLFYIYSIIRVGKGKLSDRLTEPKKRLKHAISGALLHMKEATKEEMVAHMRPANEFIGGLAHVFVFYGFLLYLLSYINDPFLRGLFPQLSIPIFEHPFYLFIQDLAGLAILLGIIMNIYRRTFMRVPNLENKWDAWIILFLISCLVISNYVLRAAQMVINPIYPTPLVSGILSTMINEQLALPTYLVFWWIQLFLLASFTIVTIYSKGLHMLISPFSAIFMEIRGTGFIDKVEISEEESYGAEKLNEFRWREILNPFACTNCGRCDRVCPALNTSSKLSPRLLIYNKLRGYALTEGGKYLRGEKNIKSILGGYVSAEEIWDCYFCVACSTVCPVFNEHYNVIVQLRRRLLEAGEVDPGIQDTLMSFYRYGNSFMKPPRERADWTKTLDFKIKDARLEKAEFLWFVGDYASYHPNLQEVTRKVAKVFRHIGLDFSILHDAEQNAGNDVRRIGEEGLFEILVEKNISTLKAAKFDKIITTDPHTFNVLRNEYPLFGASYPVYHYTEILNSIIQPSMLVKKLRYTVTYHDPCYLGRYNKVYDAPRGLLRKLGVKLIEMEQNKERSFCCGAGGGLIWRSKERKGKRPAVVRVEEAYNTGAELLVVACPKDYVMFTDAVKGAGLEGKIRVVDIIELVAEALGVEE